MPNMLNKIWGYLCASQFYDCQFIGQQKYRRRWGTEETQENVYQIDGWQSTRTQINSLGFRLVVRR